MRIKFCSFFISLVLAFALMCTSAAFAEIRTPAEFDPQKALWVSWPSYNYVEAFSTKETVLDMIEAAHPYTTLVVQVKDTADIPGAKSKIAERSIPLTNIQFVVAERDDGWIRDMGPVFRYNDGAKEMVDFQFTMWGTSGLYDPYSQLEGNLDRLLAKELGLDIETSWLVSEGGNREFNGQGTLMMTWAVEKQRNPEMSASLKHFPGAKSNVDEGNQRKFMEAEYKRLFNVTNIVWLEEGLVEDPLAYQSIPGPKPGTRAYTWGTGGHIDEMARFVTPTTIVLAQVSDGQVARDTTGITVQTQARLEVNYEVLKKAKDQDGQPFKIIRMPHTDMDYEMSTRDDIMNEWLAEFRFDKTLDSMPENAYIAAASSYMNFVIANGVVLVPQYYEKGADLSVRDRDGQAIAVLESVFPDRKVIGVNAYAVNLGGGGMHCITAHEPVDL